MIVSLKIEKRKKMKRDERMRYYVQEEEKLLENKISERRSKIKISLSAVIVFGALITLGYSVVGVGITESKGWKKALCNIQKIEIGQQTLCLYKTECVFLTFSGYANVSSGVIPFVTQESCYDVYTKCLDEYSIREAVDCSYKGETFRFGDAVSFDKFLLVITILFTPFFLYSVYSLVSAYKEIIEN